jgi:hypothetical protein
MSALGQERPSTPALPGVRFAPKAVIRLPPLEVQIRANCWPDLEGGASVRRSPDFFHGEKNTGGWPDRHAHYWLRPRPRRREAEARQEGG